MNTIETNAIIQLTWCTFYLITIESLREWCIGTKIKIVFSYTIDRWTSNHFKLAFKQHCNFITIGKTIDFSHSNLITWLAFTNISPKSVHILSIKWRCKSIVTNFSLLRLQYFKAAIKDFRVSFISSYNWRNLILPHPNHFIKSSL